MAHPMAAFKWGDRLGQITGLVADCGFCGCRFSPAQALTATRPQSSETLFILICTQCMQPTYVDLQNTHHPGRIGGEDVEGLPEKVNGLYQEARICLRCGAINAATMVLRKLLLNIAAAEGATDNHLQSFAAAVTYLADAHLIPPKSRGWVDRIRHIGNEANHEIELRTREDAEVALFFTGWLLKTVFELPSKLPSESD